MRVRSEESVSGAEQTLSFAVKKGASRMLQIKELTVTHKKDSKVIIKDFSFVLNEGDKAVLIGEE